MLKKGQTRECEVFQRFVGGTRHPSFREQYAASGSETGPTVLAGLRLAGDTVSAGGKVRYQSAAANLGARFAGPQLEPRIDLGG